MPPGCQSFPGLARYDEVAAGEIKHALRFTLQSSRAAIVPPASHWAANSTNALAAPMGMRLRLKAGYSIASYFRRESGDPARAEEVRNDHGGQRLVHVHQRRARRSLGQR